MPTPQLSRLDDLTDHDAIDEEEGSYVDLEGARGPRGEVVNGKGRRGHPRERRKDQLYGTIRGFIDRTRGSR